MEHDKINNTWQRICPQCEKVVIHKNKAKCHGAERKNTVCIKCSRSNIGKANSKTDSCPICKKTIKIPVATTRNKTCQLKSHALEHDLTSEELWKLKNPNIQDVLCRCGCEKKTKWCGWWDGYNEFICGHNANIYSSYTPEIAEQISKKRSQSLQGQTSWAKGLTKETDERIAKRSIAISIGQKKAIAAGKYSTWNKGLTKETDPRVKKAADELRNQFKNGTKKIWHKGLNENLDERLKIKSDKLKKRYATGELNSWHKGLTVNDDPRIKGFWKNRDPLKEYEHIRWSDDQIKEQLYNNIQLRLDRIECYKNDRTPALWMRCTNCIWTQKVTLIFARNDKCPKCAPQGSKGQHEIGDWLNSLDINLGRNVRGIIGRQELDLYVPSQKFAVEYNGLYWHSEWAGRDHSYHQNKTDSCNLIGISLFHIFEDEWHHKSDIIKSMIKHRLGQSLRIGARTCKIEVIPYKERQIFFEQNHIDGDTNSKIAFGLRHPMHGLVMIVSLRKPFHKTKNDVIEVARLSGKQNICVVGGLSRLTAHIKNWAKINNYDSIISYVDLRHGGSNFAWKKSGWTEISETAPRFWWTNFRKRFNRFKYRAKKSEGLTEAQVAEEAGVVKIWGCKNLKFEINL